MFALLAGMGCLAGLDWYEHIWTMKSVDIPHTYDLLLFIVQKINPWPTVGLVGISGFFDDLIVLPNPGIMLSKRNHPKMAEPFRFVNYDNLPKSTGWLLLGFYCPVYWRFYCKPSEGWYLLYNQIDPNSTLGWNDWNGGIFHGSYDVSGYTCVLGSNMHMCTFWTSDESCLCQGIVLEFRTGMLFSKTHYQTIHI